MDVGTHALASFALTRVFLPRAPRSAWLIVVAAGVLADVDALSAISGPAAYLSWHRTCTHSILEAIVVGVLLSVVYRVLSSQSPEMRVSPTALFGSVLLAEFLHLAMDACQSEGIALFWPVNGRRISADSLTDVDPWIIAMFLAAILLPELLRLVSSEIGAQDKRPRGRTGAIIGLAIAVLYIGVRATLHSSAVAMMQARTYKGELPRRAGAYPESVSLFAWHGIVETDHALHQLTVNVGPAASFDPESGVALFKPEPSPMLTSALETDAAKRFLRVARFPKATVEKTEAGYEVVLRDLRHAAVGNSRREIAVLAKIGRSGNVTGAELLWARDLRRR